MPGASDGRGAVASRPRSRSRGSRSSHRPWSVGTTILVIGLGLVATTPGCATQPSDCHMSVVGPARTLDDLMSISSAVVTGTVLSTHKGRHTNPSGAPITARIHVDRVVRGPQSIEGQVIRVLDDWSGGCGEAASEHQPVRRWSRGERAFLFLMDPQHDNPASAGGPLFNTATVSGRYTIEGSGRLASESLVDEGR